MRRLLWMLVLLVLITAQTAEAVSFLGEEIHTNPESLREEHEELVLSMMKDLALFTTDDKTGYGFMSLCVKDSQAESAIRRFEGGWFAPHRSVAFENCSTENWRGDGETYFTCECRMDCVVRFSGDVYMTYDMAYQLEYVYDAGAKQGRRWKLQSFRNIVQEPDNVDLEELNQKDEGIRIEAVTGPTFKGFIMIVSDPSRVFVGSIPRPYTTYTPGWTLDRFTQEFGAAAAVNGGGFADPPTDGKGGKPNSLVITEGEKTQNYNAGRKFGTVIGFDEEDRLVVVEGVQRADVDALPLRDAVAFSPALIIDGEAVDNTDYRNQLTARTAIGQREDGTVLMLVVDGRHPDSLGANMQCLTDIFLEHGAVNAANLDGGTSTTLVFYGRKVNDGKYPDRVSRVMPTAFLVRPLQGN
ncbi:MAG: phosphodiester glycosidase family protein [Clostridia bacterium]|nr:phosphodiester glycosidase family protein [Clostridia bacterium]